jgi:hypothetical protein
MLWLVQADLGGRFGRFGVSTLLVAAAWDHGVISL